MKHILLLMAVVFLALKSASALSEGEKSAISQILQEWPALEFVSPPWSSNASSACIKQFKGLECSDRPNEHIIGLSIYLQDSSGKLPEAIGGLIWLEQFTIMVKGISAIIPSTLGNLANLTELSITSSAYPWGFPEGILPLKNLRQLSLISNTNDPPFRGKVQPSFCDLAQLTGLTLDQVGLSGLEECTGKLPNLETLQLGGLQHMSLPLQQLVLGRPNLTKLEIRDTPIFGDLDFSNQSKLLTISLRDTYVTGPLPPSLWGNINLQNLELKGTPVRGTISAAIGKLTSLSLLQLSGTSIVGTIPPEIGLCKSLRQFFGSSTRLSGSLPSEVGNLSNLEVLDLSSTSLSGTIPKTFENLLKLWKLSLEGCKLEGTIPEGLLLLPLLSTLSLRQNRFTGTIPAAISGACDSYDLASNLLEGTIPHLLVRNCKTIKLSGNLLSGDLLSHPMDTQYWNKLEELDLANNRFEGSLPFINRSLDSSHNFKLDLSSNRFTGTIPAHYRYVPVNTIDLSYNLLEGEVSNFLKNPVIGWVKLSFNRFSGTIPPIIEHQKLHSLALSDNLLTGTIPLPPRSMIDLSLAGNLLHGDLDHFFSSLPELKSLDLSRNLFEGTLPNLDKLYPLTYLSLASNKITGSIKAEATGSAKNLVVLDLSNNRLEGQIPTWEFFGISSLLLSKNSLRGSLPVLSSFTQLSVLDISHNNFNFDIASLAPNPFLNSLSFQNNSIYGELKLAGMKSLESVDLSFNQITKVDFQSVTKLYQASKLRILSIKNNPIQETSQVYGHLVDSGSLRKTRTSIPSSQHQGVVCNQLLFGSDINTQFDYDEAIFSFGQCECDQAHFGLPPSSCRSCESLKVGSSLCDGDKLLIETNYFLFNGRNDNVEAELCIAPYLLSRHPSRISNCLGIQIQFGYNGTQMSNFESGASTDPGSLPSDSQLQVQCRSGSSGRLCSRCDCETGNIGRACYFPGPGKICEKCSTVFSPKLFVTLTLVGLLVVIIALVIFFYVVLTSKRSLKVVEWKKLSIWKRIVYRLIDMTSFGQITIMVTFVQILVELTNWNAYALRSWLRLLNGDSEGIGIRCIYPFLSKPEIALVLRLLAPLILAGIVCASIGIAELFYRRFNSSRQLRTQIVESSDGDALLYENALDEKSADDETDSLGMHHTQTLPFKNSVPYPALALATSTSISIIKFFYFGTTMASFEYLFYSVQKGTNKKFVQSVPWMAYTEARQLQMISIPFLLLFMIGFPLAFVVVSWKLRHKIASPFVRLYFGSLFENYQNHLFWWELVNIIRKLSVSLFLRGLSPENSFQPILVSLVLIFLGVLIMGLKPRRLVHENWFEGIGAILLIFSFAAGRIGNLHYAAAVSFTFLALDSIFVFVNLAIIIWRCIQDESSYAKRWKLRFGFDSNSLAIPETFGPPLLNNPDEE